MKKTNKQITAWWNENMHTWTRFESIQLIAIVVVTIIHYLLYWNHALTTGIATNIVPLAWGQVAIVVSVRITVLSMMQEDKEADLAFSDTYLSGVLWVIGATTLTSLPFVFYTDPLNVYYLCGAVISGALYGWHGRPPVLPVVKDQAAE